MHEPGDGRVLVDTALDELGIDPNGDVITPTVGYVDPDSVRAGMSSRTTTAMSQRRL